MEKRDLREDIIPTAVSNHDGESEFNTTDLIYLDSFKDVYKLAEEERMAIVTDYAIMNHAIFSKANHTAPIYLRTNPTGRYEDDVYGIDRQRQYKSLRRDYKLSMFASKIAYYFKTRRTI